MRQNDLHAKIFKSKNPQKSFRCKITKDSRE